MPDNDDDPRARAIGELTGANEALRRVILILIDSLDDNHRDAIKRQIGRFVADDDEIGNPQRGAYRETMGWFVRHIGR